MLPNKQTVRPAGSAANSADSAAIAEAIVAVAKTLRREMPAPKGSPFYGLDHNLPYAVEVLHLLGFQGIFRKYEFVLELLSGWGGRARWASRQFGCRVLGVEPDLSAAEVARLLGESSGTLGDAVFCTGQPESLPFRSGAFTHAWWLEPSRGTPVGETLAEVCRVVRDGGYLAWVVKGDEASVEIARQQLHLAGFVVTEQRRAQALPPETLQRLAEHRLERSLHERPSLFLQWKAHRGGALRIPESLVLLFARRQAKRLIV